MYIYQNAEGVVVQAPAKLNLFFEILGKRPDGYHEIETLMTPISWYDTLIFREVPSGPIHLSCRVVFPAPKRECDKRELVPEGRENLAYRAVELLRQEAGVRRGAWMGLVKRIPPGAGLGGGSADAAAALAAANLAWKLHWPRSALASLAARLGSDVPFFLADSSAICRGRGEKIEPIPSGGRWHFVVVHPPAGLSTAEVYRHCEVPASARSVEPVCKAWEEGDRAALGKLLWNRLQPTAKKLCSWVGRVQEHLEREDVLGCQLTGSGSAYFALCRHARHARRIACRLHATGLGTVVAVHSCR